MNLNNAQRVRLWLAGGAQLAALGSLFAVLVEPYASQYQLADGSTGSMLPGQVITNSSTLGYAVGAFLFQIIAVALAFDALYRIVKPPAPRYYPPSRPVPPPPPPAGWQESQTNPGYYERGPYNPA